MAIIKNNHSGQSLVLRSHHLIGRHPATSHTLLSYSTVSRSHCLIEWHNNTWFIQDISANGTFINGKRIAKNIKHPLKLNDSLCFGDLNNPVWQFTCSQKPSAFLKSVQSVKDDIPIPNKTSLIDNGHDELIVSQTLSGQWLLEREGHIEAIEPGQQIHVNNQDYILVADQCLDETQQCETLSDIAIDVEFKVSQNEEHVGIKLFVGGNVIDLGDRTHHYLVLLLARKYLDDKQMNVHESELGWLDKSLLMSETRMEETHMNTQFYRFRKQLITSLNKLNITADLIERRRGEIRMHCNSIQIIDAKVA